MITITLCGNHIERRDIETLIEDYGGKAASNVRKKTAFVVVGEKAGESSRVGNSDDSLKKDLTATILK